MSKMSRDKGARYERKIAKLLSAWSGIDLVRTPSGVPEDLYADIWPKDITQHFPLAVECKHVEGWSFDQIMTGVGPFVGWLEQAVSQSDNAVINLGRRYEPVLVFTKNRFPNMIAVCGGILFAYWVSSGMQSGPMCYSFAGRYQFGVVSLDAFLGSVRYRMVRPPEL